MELGLVVVVLFVSCAAAKPHVLQLKAPYLPEGTLTPPPQWVDQKLDHLSNDHGDKMWKQRYFVNSSWWNKEIGPVFLMLGGEGPANPAWLVADTNIMRNAIEYEALVFSVEHRFYGDSHPTQDASLESLKLLSSRQALADFAYFHDLMVKQYKLTDRNKWVCFGGSYSGALAAWLRQLYPKAVVGGVASSAPVLAKLDYVEYKEIIGQSLATRGKDCPQTVAAAANVVSSMANDKSKWKDLEKMFNVKPPLSSHQDAVQLMENLADNFEGVVQYNKDNKLFEGISSNLTIKDLCAIMTNASLGSPIQRYAAVNTLMMDGEKYLDCSYKAFIDFLKQSSWNSDAVKGGSRQWVYQTCTEFAYFQTTDSKKSSLFSDQITLDYFTDQCSQVFGISPASISSAVNRTNKFYGGKNVTGTNIVFPNGSIDPWHALSITSDLGRTVKAVFINGTAHCANMYPPRDSDLLQLTTARNTVTDLIGQWLVSA